MRCFLKSVFPTVFIRLTFLPTDDEKRQFYEMLTAEELNMKVIDRDMEGQLSFGEDAFYQKYEAQIKRLTDKFMPPKEDEPSARERHKTRYGKICGLPHVFEIQHVRADRGSGRKYKKRITWMIWRGVIPEEKDRIRNMWRCWRDLLCSIINRQP